MTDCTFEGSIYAHYSGGIIGRNFGNVTNCQKLGGKLSTDDRLTDVAKVIGGVIGWNNTSIATITGNTFDRIGSEQIWGIGRDSRLSPPRPDNTGATPIN